MSQNNSTTETTPDLKALEKLYNEILDPDTLQCTNCGIKLIGEIFKTFSFCPWCRAPKYSAKDVKNIEQQLKGMKPNEERRIICP